MLVSNVAEVPQASSAGLHAAAAGPQLWEIAWADALGHMQALQFEAGLPARAFIAKQTQRWSLAAAGRGSQPPLSQAAYAGDLTPFMP